MENQQLQDQSQMPELTDRQMLAEILENSHKTKNYMKWQLIITVALVVIPLLATVAIIPFAMKSLSSVYGISDGFDTNTATQIQDLLK